MRIPKNSLRVGISIFYAAHIVRDYGKIRANPRCGVALYGCESAPSDVPPAQLERRRLPIAPVHAQASAVPGAAVAARANLGGYRRAPGRFCAARRDSCPKQVAASGVLEQL